MADATLSSSTASDQVYAGGHQTLPSFASSFRSEDYDRPPAGIAQADWARLARGGRNQSRDEQEDDSSLQRGQDDSLGYEYKYEGRARPARGTASPASTTIATTTAALADNRRTAPISLDSSTATEVSEAAENTFDDSAGAGDRTETTNHHLRSGVLDLSSSAAGGGASSSSRPGGGGDDSSSFANVYGGGGGGLRTATRDSSKGGGGAMTLREQEKVRQVLARRRLDQTCTLRN